MKKFIVLALIIIAVIAAFFVVLNQPAKQLSDKEKQQALINILGRKPNLTDDNPTGNKTYKSNYVSFMYPSKAKIYTYREPNISKNTSVLEIFSFDITNPRIIFNYSAIQHNSLQGVSDIPDVKLRQLQKDAYVQENAYADNKTGLVFEKIQTQGLIEKTAFFLVNGKSYSFSIQGNDIKEIRSFYNDIISSIRFL
jgi:hypothetical protein